MCVRVCVYVCARGHVLKVFGEYELKYTLLFKFIAKKTKASLYV